MTLHRGGLELVSPDVWATLTLKVLLLSDASTAAPTPDDIYVSSLVPASNESIATGYARETLTGLAATWNGTLDRWELEADVVNFGVLTGAGTGATGVKGWALYAFVTNDADSPLIRTYTGASSTFSGGDVLLSWVDGVVLTVAEEP